MFKLPGKRRALDSPESAEGTKKDKKHSKKDLKNKSKCEMKAAAKLVSPTKTL